MIIDAKALSPVMQSLISYVVQEIRGKDGTDATEFTWQNGSICTTKPATPDDFRGNEVFKELKSLPPTKQFNGTMIVNRQLGVVKTINFLHNT